MGGAASAAHWPSGKRASRESVLNPPAGCFVRPRRATTVGTGYLNIDNARGEPPGDGATDFRHEGLRAEVLTPARADESSCAPRHNIPPCVLAPPAQAVDDVAVLQLRWVAALAVHVA